MVGVVEDHILPVAFGTGSNGKSTLLGTLMDVFGSGYAMKCPPDLLLAKRNDSHPTDRASLFGKRLVVAIETEENRRLNESMVKELTGGDDITARRMREDFWTYKPSHTVFMATNHKPVIRGTDRGIWRRVKLVPFTVAVGDAVAIKDMPARLRAEWGGILAWCVRGCLAWQARGLATPDEVVVATAKYRGDQDLLGLFMAEHTVLAPNAKAKASALYARYKEWAEAGGEFVISQRAFGDSLAERGFEKKQSNGAWYLGIGLAAGDGHADVERGEL
jgi:putative DNA primase/helicase